MAEGKEDPFDDGDVYKFMVSLSKQNQKILDKLDTTNTKIDLVAATLGTFVSEHEHHMEKSMNHMVRKIKGIGANIGHAEMDTMNATDKLALQAELEKVNML